MADTAARLADPVFPMAPVRQWVLSFPIEIRYRLAHDGALLTSVLRTFMQHLDAFYRDQARVLGHADGRVSPPARPGAGTQPVSDCARAVGLSAILFTSANDCRRQLDGLLK